MSQKIKLKRSNLSGNIPSADQLDIGEIALNMADSKLFFKDPSNNVKQITTAASLASLTDTDIVSPQLGAILRYDGTNWDNANSFKILNNGHVTVGGAGDVHAFNVYATGLNSRLSFQSESGGNPGIELSTDKTGTRRVLMRLQEVGSQGTILQFFARPTDGSAVINSFNVRSDKVDINGNAEVNGDLSVTGTTTSNNIQLGQEINLTNAGKISGASAFNVIFGKDDNTAGTAIYGGSTFDTGGGFVTYGNQHASKAGETWFYYDGFQERMVIKNEGVDVNGSLRINVTDGGANPWMYKAGDSAAGVSIGQSRSRGTLDIPTSLQDGDIVGGLSGLGHDGTDYIFTAGIRYKVDGTTSTGVMPQKITFETGDTSSSSTKERLVIKPDGKINFNDTTGTPKITWDPVSESFAVGVAGEDNYVFTFQPNPDFGLTFNTLSSNPANGSYEFKDGNKDPIFVIPANKGNASEFKYDGNEIFHEGSTGNKGDMFYHDGTKWVKLAAGSVGQILSVGSDGTPEWQDLTVR